MIHRIQSSPQSRDPDPAATYTMNASYAVSEWNAAMFRDAFRQKVSNEAKSILDSIGIAA